MLNLEINQKAVDNLYSVTRSACYTRINGVYIYGGFGLYIARESYCEYSNKFMSIKVVVKLHIV